MHPRYSHQTDMLKAECERNIQMATAQFQQQRDQAIMALDQQQKQQEMELNMAKQQRTMAISQQAASMQSQATQYKSLAQLGRDTVLFATFVRSKECFRDAWGALMMLLCELGRSGSLAFRVCSRVEDSWPVPSAPSSFR